MTDAPQDLQRLAPEKLTATFSRSRIFPCLLIAVAVHLVLLAATSVVYVRDTWIDPDGAARRKATKLAAKKAEEEAAAPSPKATAETAGDAAPKTGTAAAKTTHETEMDKRKDAPVIKGITAKAKKDEIPKEPDGLGITIDETNP